MVTVVSSTLRDNFADFQGGAINAYDVLVTDSTISGNRSGMLGGGIGAYNSVTLARSTVSGNSTGMNGGGIASYNAVFISTSTISGNSADNDGGGLFVYMPSAMPTNLFGSTITNNFAGNDAGGVFLNSTASATLSHTIVAGNFSGSAQADPIVDIRGAIDGSFSLVQDLTGATVTGTIISGVDPLLGPLSDNGGPTRTHALLPGSPVLDAGDPAAVAGMDNIPQFDQRGTPFSRVFGIIDIGAFELDAADFGDADAPFPTLLADNGAYHFAVGPRLGNVRDIESDGQPTTAADGDDMNGMPDDEEGVTLATLNVGQTGATFTVNVQNAPAGAMLDAWIDFNGDGMWEVSEQIADSQFVTGSDNTLTFDVPADAVSGMATARFRLSSAGNLEPTGGAADGEVEDYLVEITSLSWHNFAEPTDVNAVDGTTPLDALLVINELTLREISDPTDGSLPVVANPPPFLDVVLDGIVAPLDALCVINFLDGTPCVFNAPAPSSSVSAGHLPGGEPSVTAVESPPEIVSTTRLSVDEAAIRERIFRDRPSARLSSVVALDWLSVESAEDEEDARFVDAVFAEESGYRPIR